MFIQPATHLALIRLSSVSELQLYEAALADFKKNHKGILISAGSYERDLITIRHSHKEILRVRIQRFRLPDGSTHAVLSDLWIPESSYSVRFVLSVLLSYLHRKCSVRAFCSHWQISVSALYEWIHLFERHYAEWAGILSQAQKLSDEMLALVSCIPSFLFCFRCLFQFSFLQRTHTPFKICLLPP